MVAPLLLKVTGLGEGHTTSEVSLRNHSQILSYIYITACNFLKNYTFKSQNTFLLEKIDANGWTAY